MHHPNRPPSLLLIALLVIAGTGCFGGGRGPASQSADLGELGLITTMTTRGRVFEIPARQMTTPALSLPTSIAVARVQAEQTWNAHRRSYDSSWRLYVPRGGGHDDDLPTTEQFRRLDQLPNVQDAFHARAVYVRQNEPLVVALRRGALNAGAGLLMIVTFDTWTDTSDGIMPLTLVSLGTLPDVVAEATTSGHAALIDARTGYVYATAVAREETWQLASQWTQHAAAEGALRRAERRAFSRLLDDFEKAWAEVVRAYGGKP